MAENDNTDIENAVDFLMGGEESYSPANEANVGGNVQGEAAKNVAEGSDIPLEFEDDDTRFEESAEENKVTQQDEASLKQEIEVLTKRLHDTQSAMHRATEDRARLQKEMEALRAKKDDEDDWFSEEDNSRLDEVEKELKATDEQLAELDDKAAIAIWDAAAAKVRSEHPDFDKVVYEEFAPKIDETSGDPQVIRLWNEQKDKSPANAYAFAKKLDDMLLLQSNPEAYKEKIRAEVMKEINGGTFVTGKDGLDLMNSADVPEGPAKSGGGAVDFIFG